MPTTSTTSTAVSSTPSDSPAGADAEKLEVKEGEQDGNGGIDDNDSQRTDEAWKRSPSHPRNFTTSRKWKNAMVIALSGCLSTVGSSIFVPAVSQIRSTYGVSQEVATLTTVMYVAGLGCGPFVFAPISELWGRQRAYSTSMIGFTAMNMGCCFVNSLAGLVILRTLAGFFGSSGPGLGVATISDRTYPSSNPIFCTADLLLSLAVFEPKQRGRPLSIYAIGPMLGPILGSIIGNYLVLSSLHTFYWPFRFLTILVGLNTLSVILIMDETYEPVCRRVWDAEQQARRAGGQEEELRKEERKVKAIKPSRAQTKEVFLKALTRPPRMLANPVCLVFGIYYAYVYAIVYVSLVSLPLLFARHTPPTGLFTYGWPAGTAGLCYIGLGIGFVSSAFTAAIFQDRIYVALSKRYGNTGQPEYRLVITQCGMIVFPVGLLIYGWSAGKTHWIVPVLGSTIYAFGLMICFNSIQNFLVDCFFPYSAAATAASTLLRSVGGVLLPIFAPRMFVAIGYGWGATLLALVTLPIVPAPFVLFLYGARMREKWKFKP